SKTSLDEATLSLEGAAGRLLAEWRLALILWDETHPLHALELHSAEETVRAASHIRNALKRYESRNSGNVADAVRDAFFQTRNALQEYMLEMRYLEQGDGRLIIESVRDRNAPLSPRRLLDELRKLE